ncbi:uncharacterized protein LOC108431367 isoform X2 [Pygocentrus nattereri]|uniref:uncharacterized protein LOC108431367 isoform X2 n=1 Tax=Pygocentrus nattereri TaxID=42514 RepID=UPI001890F11B|nr:uncharacterized protein LOC108431367 isoform X2 [Pygocentrus nattereri]
MCSVILPCYVEAPLPLEELEVEWKRTDSETLVHLFQDRESRPEAQDQAYSGRASFFTEEVERGNFSLLLTNLTTKDAGIYNCSVYSQQETGKTSVEIEFLIGGHAVSAYAREDVTLNCSIDSHIPPELLEVVSWTKVDQDITVLVFQEGEVQEDFTHERFRERVEFFGPEEIQRGNFSLRLKDLQLEDKGLYRCEVLSGEFSAQTTVEIHLGFSHTHNMILFLCGFTCFCGSVLFLGFIPYTFCKELGSCTVIIQDVLVFGPNILMFVAFVLWGVLNGFISVAITCSTINLLRTLWLLPFFRCFNHFYGTVKETLAISLIIVDWVVLSVIAAVVFGLHGWRIQNNAWMGYAGFSLVVNIIFVAAILFLFLSESKWTACCFDLAFFFRCAPDFIILLILFTTREVIDTIGNVGLILLIVLAMCCIILAFTVMQCYGKMSEIPALIKKLYPLGAAVLCIVNSVTLAVELISQAGEGERPVKDLRLIIIPFEMASVIIFCFVWCCSCSTNQRTVL